MKFGSNLRQLGFPQLAISGPLRFGSSPLINDSILAFSKIEELNELHGLFRRFFHIVPLPIAARPIH